MTYLLAFTPTTDSGNLEYAYQCEDTGDVDATRIFTRHRYVHLSTHSVDFQCDDDVYGVWAVLDHVYMYMCMCVCVCVTCFRDCWMARLPWLSPAVAHTPLARFLPLLAAALSGVISLWKGSTDAERYWGYECSLVVGADLINCQEEDDAVVLSEQFSFNAPEGRVITGACMQLRHMAGQKGAWGNKRDVLIR